MNGVVDVLQAITIAIVAVGYFALAVKMRKYDAYLAENHAASEANENEEENHE